MEMKQSNPNALKDLSQRVAGLTGAETKVGWFEQSVYPSGRPVAAVAYGNEFGIASRSIPPRPFMRPTAIDKQGEWREAAARLVTRVLDGKMTSFEAMDALGGVAEGDIAATIRALTQPPLSPITLGARKYRSQGKTVTGATIGEIARKLKDGTLDISGVSTKPLVDSAEMILSLDHKTSAT